MKTKQADFWSSPSTPGDGKQDDGRGILFALAGFAAGYYILVQGLQRHLTLQAYALSGLFLVASATLIFVIIHKKLAR